ncbi:hypothetical protein [Pedobacter sp. SYSU D00535]|uniref:hypothetical protein n=1 Tax=Pedobacter sp. SYSU D00535 TaxID=2810308 RepID=UPI001A97394F|nr:hypothetical protein [Pedobacter sp. SYSU D00535]
MKKITVLVYLTFLLTANLAAQTAKVDSANIIEGVYVLSETERARVTEINMTFAKKTQELSKASENKEKRILDAKKLRQEKEVAIKKALGAEVYRLYSQNRFSKAKSDSLNNTANEKATLFQQKLGVSKEQATELAKLRINFERQKRTAANSPFPSQAEVKSRIALLKKAHLDQVKNFLPAEKIETYLSL